MKNFVKSIFASALGFLLAQLTILFLFFALIGAIISQNSTVSTVENGDEEGTAQILKIHLLGNIPEYRESVPDSFRPFLHREMTHSLSDYIQAIRGATDDEEISGIYLSLGKINAGWASLTSLRKELESFRKSGKFIFSYAENYSEKSYYIASVADTIHMYSEGSFEHNGIAAIPMFIKGLLDKLEVKPLIFKVGSFKSAVEPFTRTDMSPAARLQTKTLLYDLWNHYLTTISKARTIPANDLTEWAEKLTITNAKEAFSNKFVDLLKSESELFTDLKKKLSIPDDKKLLFKRVSAYSTDQQHHAFSFAKKREKLEGDNIAIIHVSGEITSGYSSEKNVGSKTLIRQLRKAKKDDAIKAIVLRINSPGGSALASDVVWSEATALDSIKPVVVSMSDVAASGGYYIAAGGRYIFAEPTTITGSIGVFGIMFNLKDFLNNKLGVTTDKVTTHSYSDIGQSSRDMSSFERSIIQTEVNSTYNRFLQVVASARKISHEEADKIGQGRVWSGTAAKEIGLIDEIGSLSMAVKKAAEFAGIADYNTYVVPPREEPWQWLFSSLTSRVRSFWIDQEEWTLLQKFRKIKQRQGIFTLLITPQEIR